MYVVCLLFDGLRNTTRSTSAFRNLIVDVALEAVEARNVGSQMALNVEGIQTPAPRPGSEARSRL